MIPALAKVEGHKNCSRHGAYWAVSPSGLICRAFFYPSRRDTLTNLIDRARKGSRSSPRWEVGARVYTVGPPGSGAAERGDEILGPIKQMAAGMEQG